LFDGINWDLDRKKFTFQANNANDG